MVNITISDWLYDKVIEHCNTEVKLIPNAIDETVFYMSTSPENRYPHSVAMIYQTGKHKGFLYGYQAILKLKELYPDLRCNIFGTSKRPKTWPKWIKYTRNADEKQLLDIYNKSAVFISSSIIEGYGLCGAESMACGCAFVSSDYNGMHTYATVDKNVLVAPICNTNQIVENVVKFFNNNKLRIEFAYDGHNSVNKISLKNSFKKMIQLINE